MANELHLTVLTPERAVLDQEVYSVTAPGSAGYLGVLRGHAPLITSLVPGKLTVKDLRQQATVYAVGGGFMEINSNKVIILADTLEAVEEINMAEAVDARNLAERRVRDAAGPVEKEEAVADLARLDNRVRVKRNPGPSV